MLFVLMGKDRPGEGTAIRKANRAAHLEFVARNPDVFKYGGALLDDDGKMVGSLMMVELPDREALARFLEEEPYSRAGLFEPYHVHETRQVVPEPTPGFIEQELAREHAQGG